MNTIIISKHLQLLRKTNYYTQEDLAKKLNLSRQAISKWETGTTIPDLEVLLKLSKLYGLTINEIIEPDIQMKKITDFEQLSLIPKDDLKEILIQFDEKSLVVASMGASPEINDLLEKIFKDINFKLMRDQIGRVRIEEVEDMQNQIITLINLQDK